MQLSVTKRGKVKIKTDKFKFVNKVSLGEAIAIFVDTLILLAIFMVG